MGDLGKTVNHSTPGALSGASQRADDLPQQFGRYRILRKLGEGGMGTVYLARDSQLDRNVALKVPRFSDDPGQRILERFYREARAAATIHHPHLCPVYDVGQVEGTPYLTMAFIEGKPLSEFLRGLSAGKFLPERQAANLVRKVAQALEEAHAKGIIHRDLKPHNIMLDARREPIVMDFGLARRTHGDDVRITQSGAVMGSPAYMSPEQVIGKSEEIGPATDIYSLGVILYEMLAGRLPFQGPVAAVLGQILSADPPPLEQFRSGIDPELSAICLKAIARNAPDRHASMGELARALAGFVRGKSTSGTVRPLFPELPEETSIPAATETRKNQTGAVSRLFETAVGSHRARKLAWVVLGGFIAAALAVAFFAVRTGSDPTAMKESAAGVSPAPPAPRANAPEADSSSASPPAERIAVRPDWHGWPAEAPPPAVAPFDSAQARHHQREWAAYLGTPVEFTNSIGMKFTLVPPGEFMMGGTETEVNDTLQSYNSQTHWRSCILSELPRHKVILTRPFYLGVYEVTQAQYEAVTKTKPSHFAPTGAGSKLVAGLATANHPIDTVSWNGAMEFCRLLSRIEDRVPFDPDGDITSPAETGYRLPTEAEWEFACRAGTPSRYSFGEDADGLRRAGWYGWVVQNVDSNSGGRTHAVGELQPNPFGLFDVHGNVWEWVYDRWAPDYYNLFQDRPAVDPAGPSSEPTRRVFRGGSYFNPKTYLRSSMRHAIEPAFLDVLHSIGFRVALPIAPRRRAP